MLWGRDKSLFDDSRDLVALAPVDTDRLNVFLKSYVGWLFQVSNALNVMFKIETYYRDGETDNCEDRANWRP